MTVIHGYIEFNLLEGETENVLTITYPAVKPGPGKFNTFLFKIIDIIRLDSGTTLSWWFTDGVYSIGEDDFTPTYYEEWTEIGAGYDFPADWNRANTTLTLTIYHEPTESGKVACDHFTLTIEGVKIQYLPIMGIG